MILQTPFTTAGAALRMWEETGIGQSWTSKALKSITSSQLFYSRAEYRYVTVRVHSALATTDAKR
jgi:hypothetical protein